MTEQQRRLWLHFLWSFALSDHLGDACEAVRSYAKRAGLPIPGPYAELDTASKDPDESWLAWVRSQGVASCINSEEAKALGVDGGRLESPEAAVPSKPKRAVVAIETLEQVIAEIRALSIIELGNADLIDRDDVLAKLAALIRQEAK